MQNVQEKSSFVLKSRISPRIFLKKKLRKAIELIPRTPDGATVGTGVLAHQPWGREVHPWERRGLIQCDVRYADDAPLHTTLGGTDVLDDVDRGASI